MNNWRGKWALVTGASSGIGEALADELAALGANLVIVARRHDRLTQLAIRLRDERKVQVEVHAADLSRRADRDALCAAMQAKQLAIDILVNNAGFGAYGELHEVSLDRLLEMTELNVSAVVHLTRLFVAPMIERRRGDILIVSSTAAFQGVPYISTYAATKAFDLIFGEGLAGELHPHGIRLTVLCPGSTTSEFHEVAHQPAFTKGRQETAAKVARTGLRALARGKPVVISGAMNWLLTETERLAPRALAVNVAGKMFRKRRA